MIKQFTVSEERDKIVSFFEKNIGNNNINTINPTTHYYYNSTDSSCFISNLIHNNIIPHYIIKNLKLERIRMSTFNFPCNDRLYYSSVFVNKFGSCSGNISVDFLEKHMEKINWESLSSNKYIPFSFFKKHIDKINWENICVNKIIPFF